MIVKEIISKNAITKSKLPVADYVVNAYIGCPHKCIYCYAEFMRRFTNHYEEWGDFIDIKIFDKIKIPKDIENKSITISSVTDPYNNYEIKYKKTRQVLEALKDTGCNTGILTKSKNVHRDIQLFKQLKNIEVGVSLNTVDDSFRKLIEPAAGAVEERIGVLKTLREQGIKNWLFMSPIFPFLSDYKKIIERTKDFVDYYGFENLNLRAGYKFRVLALIEQKYNHLYKHYKDIYIKGNAAFWSLLEKEIISYCEDNNIEYRMYFYHEKIKKQ
ncbi:MAG: radical SAM protein [Spirochaetaceae bacterium]|jgi:DNA repair photolyase|nr:radical SAM protein [Spirochaetaceae bacterium]